MRDQMAALLREHEEWVCLAAEARAGAQDEDTVTAAVLYEIEAAAVEQRIAALEGTEVAV